MKHAGKSLEHAEKSLEHAGKNLKHVDDDEKRRRRNSPFFVLLPFLFLFPSHFLSFPPFLHDLDKFLHPAHLEMRKTFAFHSSIAKGSSRVNFH